MDPTSIAALQKILDVMQRQSLKTKKQEHGSEEEAEGEVVEELKEHVPETSDLIEEETEGDDDFSYSAPKHPKIDMKVIDIMTRPKKKPAFTKKGK